MGYRARSRHVVEAAPLVRSPSADGGAQLVPYPADRVHHRCSSRRGAVRETLADLWRSENRPTPNGPSYGIAGVDPTAAGVRHPIVAEVLYVSVARMGCQ